MRYLSGWIMMFLIVASTCIMVYVAELEWERKEQLALCYEEMGFNSTTVVYCEAMARSGGSWR